MNICTTSHACGNEYGVACHVGMSISTACRLGMSHHVSATSCWNDIGMIVMLLQVPCSLGLPSSSFNGCSSGS